MIKRFKYEDYPNQHVECDDVSLPFYNYSEIFTNQDTRPFIYAQKNNGQDFVLLGTPGGAHSEIFSDFRRELSSVGCGTREKALCARMFKYSGSSKDAPAGFITAWVSEEPSGYSSSNKFKRICKLLFEQGVNILNYSILVECFNGIILEGSDAKIDAIYEVRVADYINMGLSSFRDIPEAYELQEKKSNISHGDGKPSWNDLPYRLYRWQSDESKNADSDELLTESYRNSIIKIEADKQNPEGGFICGCDVSIPEWNVRMNNEDKRTNPLIYMVGPDGKDYVYVGGPGEDHSDVFVKNYDEIQKLGLKAYGDMVRARIYHLSEPATDVDVPPGLLVFWCSIAGNSSKEVRRMVELLKKQGIDIEDYYIGAEITSTTGSFYTRTSALYFIEVSDYMRLNLDAVDEIKDEYDRREKISRSSSSVSGKASWHDLPYRLERWQSDESVDKTLKNIIKEYTRKILYEMYLNGIKK